MIALKYRLKELLPSYVSVIDWPSNLSKPMFAFFPKTWYSNRNGSDSRSLPTNLANSSFSELSGVVSV
jgi:hypothetical protein